MVEWVAKARFHHDDSNNRPIQTKEKNQAGRGKQISGADKLSCSEYALPETDHEGL